ncbi:MAG: IPT/TIG domain-containing protein [Bryobacteraceae bacterium]
MLLFRLNRACLAFALLSGTAKPAAPGYIIETVAGSSLVGDGGPAALASLSDAEGVCTDRAGNVYVSDANDHRVRKITPGGTISTVAGTGVPGFDGDNGPAVQARLNLPYGVAVDGAGNLYIADLGNNRVRRVDSAGVIATVAGNASAKLQSPRNVLMDGSGNLYVSEFDGHRIRRIAADGTSAIIAGTGVPGFEGDGGPGAAAKLNAPAGMAFDNSGNLYFADSGNQRIRRISAGRISTVIGTADAGASGANQLNIPTSVGIDAAGNLFIADAGNHRIRKLAASGVVSTIPGKARDLALDRAGYLILAGGNRVQAVSPAGVLSTIAGDGNYAFRGDGGPATAARLGAPSGLAVDAAGNLWIGDEGNGRVRFVSAAGAISTVADQLSNPSGLALDGAVGAGSVFIAEKSRDEVRKLSPGAALVTVAGNGTTGFSGDLSSARSAQLQSPGSVAVDRAGTVYIADTGNHRVRRVNANGIISTVAGPPQLDAPRALWIDKDGNLYIADSGNNSVRKLTPQGSLTIVAGAGTDGFSGDGGQAANAQLSRPRGVAVDPAGNVWVADTGNNRIRVVLPSGVIATVAGAGQPGFGGDGGSSDTAQLNAPSALAADAGGAIWIADTGNNRIRRLTFAASAISEDIQQSIGIVNAASLQTGAVAPGSIVSLFGSGLGPLNGVRGSFDSPGALATQVAGTQVLFDGTAAPLFFVQDSQINALVPPGTAGHATASVEVFYQSISRGKASLALTDTAPAIFTLAGGAGLAVLLNQDGSFNSEANAADRGSIVTFFATGGGIGGAEIGITIGSYASDVLYAGPAPGFIGLMQINARVPGGFATGGVLPLNLQAGSSASQAGVTIAVK